MIRLLGGMGRGGYFTFLLFWGLLLGSFLGEGLLSRPRTGRYMHAYLNPTSLILYGVRERMLT
jgi:hypothetical protein